MNGQEGATNGNSYKEEGDDGKISEPLYQGQLRKVFAHKKFAFKTHQL